jgi:ABC-2 type transport system ATP-binding protein
MGIELFGQKLTISTKNLLNRVGSIIEYPIFYEHLTAWQNLKIHCGYLGFYDDQAIKQVLEMVDSQILRIRL